MRARRTLAFLVFALVIIFVLIKDRAVHVRAQTRSDVRSGDWTIRHSEEAGKVEFSLMENHKGDRKTHV